MGERNKARAMLWLTPAALALLTGAAGWPGALTALALLPMLGAAMPRGLAVAAMMLTALAAALRGLPWQALALCGVMGLWAAVASVLPNRLRSERPLPIAVTGAVVLLTAALTLLRHRYGGPVCPGLAGDAVNAIAARRDSADWLVRAWRMGLVRLEGTSGTLPALQLFGVTVIPPEVRTEMLNSLRLSIEALLTDGLPRLMVVYAALTAWVTALLADALGRMDGRPGRFPPFERWYLSREAAISACILAAVSLLRWLTASLTMYQTAAMCATAFGLMYIGQGAALTVWWLKRRGWQPVTSGLLAAALAVGLSTVMMILGAADQLFDPRGLHGKREGGTSL